MVKSEFRRQKSLTADLFRWEKSINLNINSLQTQFNNVKKSMQSLDNNGRHNVDTFIHNMDSDTSKLRDILFTIEGILIEIGSIEEDFLELKNSPDVIIDDLRLLSSQTRKMDQEARNVIKLMIRESKASSDVIQEELNNLSNEIQKSLTTAETKITAISNSLEKTLQELVDLRTVTTTLSQQKII